MKTRTAAVAGILFVSVVIAANTFAQTPQDVNGWNRARWGMTEEQILGAFGTEVTRLEKRAEYKGERYATLGIDGLTIDSTIYSVRFVMNKDGRLEEIMLQPIEKDPLAAEVIFGHLEKMLIEKYGAPAHRADERKPDRRVGGVPFEGSTKLVRAWHFPTTVIELNYLELRSINLRHLTVSYTQRSSRSLDKL